MDECRVGILHSNLEEIYERSKQQPMVIIFFSPLN